MRHPKKSYPLLFFENGQTTNQETHNHKVNRNHKTKHDCWLCKFFVGERRLFRNAEAALAFSGKTSSGFWVRTALSPQKKSQMAT